MTRRRFILNAAGVLVPFAGPVVKAQYLPHRRKAFRSTGSTEPFGGLVSTTNLVEHWRLNEESGNRTGAHAGKILTDNNTVTYAAGKLGNAASFDLSNSESLSRTDSDLDGGPRDWSLTFWVYVPNTVTTQVSFVNHGYNRTNDYDYYVFTDSSGTFRARVLNSSRVAIESLPSGYSENAWNFVFVSYTHGTPGTVTASINNGTKDPKSITGGSYNSSNSNFRIGGSLVNDTYLTGQLDSFSFWTRVITDDEVTALYNSGNGLDY